MVLVIVSLVVVCAIIAVVGSRDQWGTRRCPACRYFVPRLATRCRYCHTSLPVGAVVSLLVIGGLSTSALPVQAFSLTDCHQVRLFEDDACVSAEVAPPAPPQTAQSPAPPSALLYPRETMAPFAPPLLVHLANNRTIENARAYLDWRDARTRAHDEVQRLLEQANKERGGAIHAPR